MKPEGESAGTETEGRVPEDKPRDPSRRRFIVGGLALAASIAAGCRRLGIKGQSTPTVTPIETPTPEKKAVNRIERQTLPNKAIIRSNAGVRSVDIHPNLIPVVTKEGQNIGEVLETTIDINPGDRQASLGFSIQREPQGNYHVLTNGWQSWATFIGLGNASQVIGKRPSIRSLSSSAALGNTDRLVGMRPYEESLGGQTVPFFEPGPGGEKIPDNEGRSYGWVGFRDIRMGFGKLGKSGENNVLGVIPSFDSLESIRFRQEGDSFIILVNKNLEGVLSRRNVTFRVFLGHANNYADLMIAYSKELSKIAGNIPLMKDRVIGFSWPAYGPAVTQADVQKEIIAGKGIFDTYVIDDGWETASGSLQVDQSKFPDLPGLIQQMKQAGIKPGVWVAPFKIKGNIDKLPKEWFMKDENGKPMKTPLPQPLGTLENSFQFDVSNADFRTYSIGKLVELARMGFEVFKADFLATPFTGQLQNRDKTAVEYYRQYFEEFRQSVRDALGKEIEIIGCGAPMMESIGLFNGMRISPDSALQNFGATTNRIFLSRLAVADMNTGMYHSATTVASRRILPFRDAHGLILDGVHLADEDVPMNPDKRGRLNESILPLNRLGIGNLFVGDSLARVGETGKQAWQDLINVFKLGNVELLLGGKRRPKIPARFSPDIKAA